ncbi:MAG: DMT family transporter, partial [Actinomycetota bacterium]
RLRRGHSRGTKVRLIPPRIAGRSETETAEPVRPDRITLGAFGLMVLLGGSNFVGVRFSNRELAPFWGAGLRFFVAAAVLFAIVAARRLKLPRGRALTGAVLFGVLNFGVAYGFLYWGFQRIHAGLGSVVMSTVPLLTLLLVGAHRLEPFSARGVFGALLSVVGIAVMFSQNLGGEAPLMSVLALVAGAVCVAESGVIIKRYPMTDPVTTNAVAMGIGSAILVGLSGLSGEPWRLPSRPETWAALLFLVVIGSVALFVVVIFVLNRWTASATSYAFVLFPIIAAGESALLDNEALTAGLAVGGLIVLAGVYFGALSGAKNT